MGKYRLTDEAKEAILRIHEFVTFAFGLKQADKYLNDFFDSFELIANQPLAFESVDYIKNGCRRCVCGKDSIFYRIDNDIVEIMTIIGRQDIDKVIK